jgi:pimeloyl-ACP methyl ester carboxylesterase
VARVVDRDVTAPDGRTIAVQEGGAPNGRPVLVHGGTPNSRLLEPRDVALAERQDVRLISYDRPGYGGSTRRPGRTVADCADDVRTIAAALGLERLAVWGISGGGPHALACAALLGDLVPAVAVLASPAPYGAPGLDFWEGMGELNVEDYKLMLEDPGAARAKTERDREELLATGPRELAEMLRTLLTPVDAAALDDELAEFLVRSIQDGLAPGADGWWDDGAADIVDWGFEIEAITTPVLLRHGREDRFVPFGHGEWLAGRIPGVTAILTDDDGHLTLTRRHLASVHEWLLARLD